MSDVITQLMKLCQIHKINTSPYNPQANGQNENQHKFLMSIIRIIIEKDPSNFVNDAKIGMFNWNTSQRQEYASVSAYELMHAGSPRLPHSLAMQFADAKKFEVIDASNYDNYANYLKDQLEMSQDAFSEARYRAGIERAHRGNVKFKKIETVKWLQPGKLVIVYSPPRAGATSAKLLFRFKGPYRIK